MLRPPMQIIARKPREQAGAGTDATEYILVDRGCAGACSRFVVGTATARSLNAGEWFWGHYHATLDTAVAYFDRAT